MPSLARRSSLPLDPPPYQAQASAARSSPKAAAAALATSDPVRHHRPGSTSPLLFRDPTFPLRDPSSSSSSSHLTHTLATPAEQTHSASMSTSSASSSSSYSWQDQPPSTAPSTPQLGVGGPSRTWRPTPNVPLPMRQRHRANPRNHDHPGESGENHRWLSDDEGAGRSGKMSGTRKREHHSSSSRQHHHDGYGSSGGGGGSGSGSGNETSGPSSVSRPTTGRPKTKPHDHTESAFDAVARSKRPQPRRAISMEHRSATPAALPDVGAQPPRIQDLIPPPTSPVAVARGLGAGTSSTYTTHISDGRSLTHDPTVGDESAIPDFASGRGGDGISGVGHPGQGDQGRAQDSYKRQRDTLGRLRSILGCVLCPPEPDEPIPFMHRPLTLPCGHTLSADHISIPTPAPIHIDTSLPAHEVADLQQRQQQQRLSLWSSVMCPIPSCKRYSATATTAHYRPTQVLDPDFSFDDHVSSDPQRGEQLASGVAYYPPAPFAAPEYSTDSVSETGSPLIDVNVEKIIRIVHREAARLDEETNSTTTALGMVELNDPADEAMPMPHDDLESPVSDVSASSMTLGRAPSKRRRNHLDLNPENDENLRTDQAQNYRRSDPDPLETLKKDMLSVLECDVCAMLLHEPVTTPCQHSFCSKCLSRSLDHSSRCPVCRQDLPSFAFFQDHAVNKVLLTIIKTVFGPEYEDRVATIARDERDALLDTPIFVCTLAFPGMPTILHVFEPRYRLMIRRCIESSNPRFGMVLPARGGGPPHLQGVMEYGTMLEIQSVQMLPDGRSMVETVGAHRFKLLEKGGLDGYTVGRIEKIQDITPEEEREFEAAAIEASRNRAAATASAPAPAAQAAAPAQQSIQLPTSNPNVSTTHPIPMQLPAAPAPGGPPAPAAGAPTPLEDTAHTTEEYMTICRAFIEQLRSGSAPWLLQRLNNTYGTMPEDPSEFSYWMALVMPIDEYEKARLLPIRSPRLRLKLIVHWIDSLRSSWWFSSGCVVG